MRRAKKRKWIEAVRVKHPTRSRAIDALIGDRELQKTEENKKERNRELLSYPVTLEVKKGNKINFISISENEITHSALQKTHKQKCEPTIGSTYR